MPQEPKKNKKPGLRSEASRLKNIQNATETPADIKKSAENEAVSTTESAQKKNISRKTVAANSSGQIIRKPRPTEHHNQGNVVSNESNVTKPKPTDNSDEFKDSPKLDSPLLAFGNEAGKVINEITLAPGETQRLKIILVEHREAITNAFQIFLKMFDSSHNATKDVNCWFNYRANRWFTPLNLSTDDPSKGGIEGNQCESANPATNDWRAIGFNPSKNYIWYPRDQFKAPIPIAEFIIQASQDWSDDFATFEVDKDNTMFVQTPNTKDPSLNQYEQKCYFDMVLTIRRSENNADGLATESDKGGYSGGGIGTISDSMDSGGGNKLGSLDFRHIIGGPLKACVEAQEESARATYNYITSTVLQGDEDGIADFKPVMLSFFYIKEGHYYELSLPLMSVIPIPYLDIGHIDLNFQAMVTYSNKLQGSDKYELKACYPTYTSETKVDETSNSETTGRQHININLRATTADQPAGMSKLIQILDQQITNYTQLPANDENQPLAIEEGTDH